MCAAVGLAVAVHAYASALDHEQQLAAREASEYSGHAYWMSILTNTLLAILEPGRPPAGRIFPLCQQVQLFNPFNYTRLLVLREHAAERHFVGFICSHVVVIAQRARLRAERWRRPWRVSCGCSPRPTRTRC